MKIIQPSSENQLKQCADMYISQNDFSFINIDTKFCYESIVKHWKTLQYIKLIIDNNQIVGFIMATSSMSKHSKDKYMLQEYYCTNLSGFKAAKAVKISHNDLIEYAKKNKYKFVYSQGSHMDPEHIFTRLLEKFGWDRRGHIAKYTIV
jgi:hypothetical protein